MKVAVAGDYALASGRMNLDMVVTTGKSELKAKVTGTSASPSVRVLPSSLLGDPKAIDKGLGDLLRRLR
jgi:hypothetical protein